MEQQNAEVSDIIIILKAECAEKLDPTTEQLRTLGMKVEEIDTDNGVITGTVLADHLPTIRAWPCVTDVRVEFTYVAEDPSTADDDEPEETRAGDTGK